MASTENLMESDLKVHEVTGDTPDLLETLIQMFVAVFPHDSRYTGYIRECTQLAQGTPLALIHQWVFEYQGEYVGFRLFNYLRQRNFGFSRYVGVLPQHRTRGFGRLIHEQSLKQIRLDAQTLGHPIPIGLCGELDHPATAPNEAEKRHRQERLQIFRRLGVIILEDMDYFEPYMIQGVDVEDAQTSKSAEPDRMMLYLAPIRPITHPTPELMAQLAEGVYIDNYRLTQDSWFVRRALASIGQLDGE